MKGSGGRTFLVRTRAKTGTLKTLTVYGSCVYRRAQSGKYYYFVNSKSGAVEVSRYLDSSAEATES